VRIKKVGSAGSVVAEVELRPDAVAEKRKKVKKAEEKEMGSENTRMWEIQLDCLRCANALD
jgi:hypothetical protein